VQVLAFNAENIATKVHLALDQATGNQVFPGKFSWDAVLRMDSLAQKLFEIKSTPTSLAN
jgi:hypothetical protein